MDVSVVNMDDDCLLTTREIADIFGVSVFTVRRGRKAKNDHSSFKNLPYVMFAPNVVRYRWKDVKEFINTHRKERDSGIRGPQSVKPVDVQAMPKEILGVQDKDTPVEGQSAEEPWHGGARLDGEGADR